MNFIYFINIILQSNKIKITNINLFE